MQLSSDTALAQAVAGADRLVVHTLEFDWDKNGTYAHALSNLTSAVKQINLSRDVTGSLPIETTIVEGFIGAELSITLGGQRPADNLALMQKLSPLRSDSPLYGKGKAGTPVRWRMGLATSAGTVPMMDQFTGYIESFKVTSEGEIEIRCSDTQRIHATINLPVFFMSRWVAAFGDSAQYRINSQWVIDYILRKNGIYQSPPPMPGCIYSATGHGAMVPEIGHQVKFQIGGGVFNAFSPSYVPGRWGIAFNGSGDFASLWSGRCTGIFAPVASTSWTFQYQMLNDTVAQQRFSSTTGVTGLQVILVSSSRTLFEPNSTSCGLRVTTTGQIVLDIYNGNTLIHSALGPTTLATGWRDVWARLNISSNFLNCTVEFPGQTNTGINLSGLAAVPITWYNSAIEIIGAYPVTNIQVCNATGLGTSTIYSPTFVSQCDLDPGLNEFASLPIVRGRESLEALRDVLAAEFGVAGFNESGRFFFKNRNTVRRGGISVEKVLNASSGLIGAAVTEPPGIVRNVITTRTQATFLEFSKYGTVWTLRSIDDIIVPPGTHFYKIQLDQPCYVTDEFELSQHDSTQWANADDSVTHRFVATDSSFNNIAGVVVTAVAEPADLAAGMDNCTLRVFNPSNFNIRFSTDSGTPALLLGGLLSKSDPEVVEIYRNQASISLYGEQTYELAGNEYRQLSQFVQPVAVGLLKDLKHPVPVFDQMTIVGDPRLQLLDTAEVTDAGGLGGPVTVNVERIQRTLGNGKLEDQLNVRMIAFPGRWILGHPIWSVLGSTTIPA